MPDFLQANGVTKSFKGLAAVRSLDFNIKRGEILGLIGPNGAGKTTLFNLITGIYSPDSGYIEFNGEKISGLRPHQICRRGIGRTFQIVRPFHNLSILWNVMVAGLFRGKKTSTDELKDESLDALEFVGLANRKDEFPSALTLGDRKRLELARALITGPKLLLIDELAGGLNPSEVKKCTELVGSIRNEKGITIFLIEHVLKLVMSISDRIIVLHYGEKIAEGSPKEVECHEKVIEAYLGRKQV